MTSNFPDALSLSTLTNLGNGKCCSWLVSLNRFSGAVLHEPSASVQAYSTAIVWLRVSLLSVRSFWSVFCNGEAKPLEHALIGIYDLLYNFRRAEIGSSSARNTVKDMEGKAHFHFWNFYMTWPKPFSLLWGSKHLSRSLQWKFELFWTHGSKVMSNLICEETCTNCHF